MSGHGKCLGNAAIEWQGCCCNKACVIACEKCDGRRRFIESAKASHGPNAPSALPRCPERHPAWLVERP